MDLGCSGPEHTWARGLTPATYKSARLDRALANEDFRVMFPEAAVVRTTVQSLLVPLDLRQAIKPFRFG